MSDPYAVLGLSASASVDEIRSAYRGRMRAVHPDTKHGDEEAAKTVNAAYALLSDPNSRRRYDMARNAAARRRDERVGEPAYCPHCGIDLSQVVSAQAHLARHRRERLRACQICDRGPAQEVLYRSVVGVWLFWRRYRFSARVCKHCSTGAFREMQARTLAFGWWSYVGFFLTPYYLVRNSSQVRLTQTLRTPEPNDPLIEATLTGTPVFLRRKVIVVLAAVALVVIVGVIGGSFSSPSASSSAAAEAGTATDGPSPSITDDLGAASSWAVDSCVAINPDDGRVRPVACSSSLAAGSVVSVKTGSDLCSSPADIGVELQTGRVACVDDWSYEFRDRWRIGACVTFDNDLVELVDCASGQVDGHIVAITSTPNACPARVESYMNYDADNVVCLSHSR